MIGWRPSLWPRSLGGRLVLLLVATLAGSQVLLVLLLRSQQDAVIERIARSQALSQTVTLARLLDTSPPAEGPRLAQAFRSREACAMLADTPPPARAMSGPERNLADLLARMLHGVRAGPPQVAIAPSGALNCGVSLTDDAPWMRRPGDDREMPSGPPGPEHGATVALTVPLAEGRWLTLFAAVGLPGGLNRATLWSFLISAIAVAAVTMLGVRRQTRSLRALAEASERLGRGERVAPLAVAGPSEVASAIRAFNTMQERLGQFMRDRLKLIAGISHDLRTPLTTLRLKAEFVDDAAVREDLVATIDELAAICEATLAFTRAEAQDETTQSLDLRALCAELADQFALSGADVEIASGAPFPLACRPVALKRALRNVIENAVRYGGCARISLTRPATPSGSEAVAIRIDDDGPGLPADQMEDAFKPFVRLEASRNAATGGIGLGLSIARSIVRAHGGELTLENRPDGGLRAQIVLPTTPAAGPT